MERENFFRVIFNNWGDRLMSSKKIRENNSGRWVIAEAALICLNIGVCVKFLFEEKSLLC